MLSVGLRNEVLMGNLWPRNFVVTERNSMFDDTIISPPQIIIKY